MSESASGLRIRGRAGPSGDAEEKDKRIPTSPRAGRDARPRSLAERISSAQVSPPPPSHSTASRRSPVERSGPPLRGGRDRSGSLSPGLGRHLHSRENREDRNREERKSLLDTGVLGDGEHRHDSRYRRDRDRDSLSNDRDADRRGPRSSNYDDPANRRDARDADRGDGSSKHHRARDASRDRRDSGRRRDSERSRSRDKADRSTRRDSGRRHDDSQSRRGHVDDERDKRRDRERRRSRSPSRELERDRGHYRNRRDRKRSYSDDSESESSKSVDSEEDRRRRRKEKRRREEKEDRRRRKDKEKKSKKKIVATTAASTASWGKYGVIGEGDMSVKGSEFRAWLVEERQLNPDTLQRDRTKKEFAVFVEDYNTATLSHEKYYDLPKYQSRMNLIKSGATLPIDGGSYNFAADMKSHKATIDARYEKPAAPLSREEIMELRRVESERIEIGQRRLLGLDIPKYFGVRTEEVDRAVLFDEPLPYGFQS